LGLGGVRVGVGFGLVTSPFNTSLDLAKMTSGQFAGWKIVLTRENIIEKRSLFVACFVKGIFVNMKPF
jgi:hypothetical protein